LTEVHAAKIEDNSPVLDKGSGPLKPDDEALIGAIYPVICFSGIVLGGPSVAVLYCVLACPSLGDVTEVKRVHLILVSVLENESVGCEVDDGDVKSGARLIGDWVQEEVPWLKASSWDCLITVRTVLRTTYITVLPTHQELGKAGDEGQRSENSHVGTRVYGSASE